MTPCAESQVEDRIADTTTIEDTNLLVERDPKSTAVVVTNEWQSDNTGCTTDDDDCRFEAIETAIFTNANHLVGESSSTSTTVFDNNYWWLDYVGGSDSEHDRRFADIEDESFTIPNEIAPHEDVNEPQQTCNGTLSLSSLSTECWDFHITNLGFVEMTGSQSTEVASQRNAELGEDDDRIMSSEIMSFEITPVETETAVTEGDDDDLENVLHNERKYHIFGGSRRPKLICSLWKKINQKPKPWSNRWSNRRSNRWSNRNNRR